MVHGWRWDKILGTWMQVRQDTNGSKIHIMIPGWVSDWIWMDTICSFRDPREDETWPGWRWDAYIETWDELRSGWMWDVNITPGLYNLDPPPSRWQITSIKVPKLHLSSTQYPYQSHPDLISLHVLPHLHLGSCLNSIHVSSDLIMVTPPSISRLTCILVLTFTSHLHQGWVSPPSSSHNARH